MSGLTLALAGSLNAWLVLATGPLAAGAAPPQDLRLPDHAHELVGADFTRLVGEVDQLRVSMWRADADVAAIGERLQAFGDECVELVALLGDPDETTRQGIADFPPGKLQGMQIAYRRLASGAYHARAQNDLGLPADRRLALFEDVLDLARVSHPADTRRTTFDAYWFAWSLYEAGLLIAAERGPGTALEYLERHLSELDAMYFDRLGPLLGGLDPDAEPRPHPYDLDHGPKRWDFGTRRLRAKLLIDLGRLEEALECCRRNLRDVRAEYEWQVSVPSLAADAPDLLAQLAWFVRDRADAYARMGLLDQTTEATRSMEQIIRQLHESPAVAERHVRDVSAAALRTGELLLELGLHRQVEAFADEALRDLELPEFTARIRFLRARALDLAASEQPPAERDARREQLVVALTDLAGVLPDDDGFVQSVELARAQVELSLGRAAAARESFERAVGRRPGPGGLRLRLNVARLEAAIGLAEGAAQDELARARDALQGAYRDEVRSWAAAPLRPGGVGFLAQSEVRHALATLVDLHVRCAPTDGAELGLGELCRAQAGGTLARYLGAAVDGATTRPAEGRGYAVLLPAPERSWLLLHDAQGALAFPLEADTVLRRAALEHSRAARGVLHATGDEAEERARAAELAQLLLPPGAGEHVAAWKEVTLVGFDLLGRHAVEFLPGPWGEHLCTARPVDFLPSIPLGEALLARRRADPTPARGVFVVADPALAGDVSSRWSRELPALGITSKQVRSLTSAYGADARVLRGADATPERIAEGLAGDHAVAQLLTHGVHQAERERSAALLCAPGADRAELLTCERVDGGVDGAPLAVARKRLVIVTACRAGVGPDRGGDTCSSDLGGAFLRAGADVVATSRSDLEVGVTLDLSEALHRGLTGGASPAEALRAARAELAERGVSPLRTGLLRLHGLGHVEVFPEGVARPSRGPSAVVATAIGALLAALLAALVAALVAALAAALAAVAIARRRRPTGDALGDGP